MFLGEDPGATGEGTADSVSAESSEQSVACRAGAKSGKVTQKNVKENHILATLTAGQWSVLLKADIIAF